MRGVILMALMGLAGGFSVLGQELLEVEAQGLKVAVAGVSPEVGAEVKAVVVEQLALSNDRVASAPLADDMAFFVRQRYLEVGYPEAKVDWTLEDRAMVLRVGEGRRYAVGKVSYEGEVSASEEEMTRYLLRATHERSGREEAHPPFVKTDVESGVGLVQRYLQAQGFLDAVVSAPVFVWQAETATVDVKVSVAQGKRYAIGKVTMEGGAGGLNKREEREPLQLLEDLQGQPFSEVKIEETRAALAGLYQRKGHFGVEVTVTADRTGDRDGVVPVRYEVKPGAVYRVRELKLAPHFSGGAQRLIQASYKRALGRVYSPTDLELLHRRVLDTEVFGRLEVTPQAVDGDELVLELTGEEAKTLTLSAYAGYETFLGPVGGLEARKVNVFDSGNTVRVKAEGTGRGLNGGVLWLDPAILSSAYALEAEIAAQTFSIFDYDRRTLSLRMQLSRQWNKHITTSVFGEYAINTVESDGLTEAELGPEKYRVLTVGASAVFDFRDSPVLPTRGWMSSLAMTGGMDAGGGEVGYLRSDLSVSFYQPVSKRLRAAFHANTSAMQSDGGIESLPIDLRLFNGGANSVRSFPEREMGLKSKTGTPLGGTLSQVFTAELSYAVIPNLELALFGDAGTLSREEDQVFAMPGDFRYAVGLGIRYKLPIGPLRVDYGYNPDRAVGEPAGALHITFGFPF